jgi:hypothetical protein
MKRVYLIIAGFVLALLLMGAGECAVTVSNPQCPSGITICVK